MPTKIQCSIAALLMLGIAAPATSLAQGGGGNKPANAGLTSVQEYEQAFAQQRIWFRSWEEMRDRCDVKRFLEYRRFMQAELALREREFNQIKRLGEAADQGVYRLREDLYLSAKRLSEQMNATQVPKPDDCKPPELAPDVVPEEMPNPATAASETPNNGAIQKIPMVNMMSGTFETGWGEMRLIGGNGRYDHDGGTIATAKIDGAVAEGTWTQSDSGKKCSDGRYWGRFRFTFTPTGFTGTWSYCDEPLGGSWEGKRK